MPEIPSDPLRYTPPDERRDIEDRDRDDNRYREHEHHSGEHELHRGEYQPDFDDVRKKTE